MVYSCACTPSAGRVTHTGSRRASQPCPRLSTAALRRQGDRAAGDDRSRAPGVRYAMHDTPNARTCSGFHGGHSQRGGRALHPSCGATERRSAAGNPTHARSTPGQPAAERRSAAPTGAVSAAQAQEGLHLRMSAAHLNGIALSRAAKNECCKGLFLFDVTATVPLPVFYVTSTQHARNPPQQRANARFCRPNINSPPHCVAGECAKCLTALIGRRSVHTRRFTGLALVRERPTLLRASGCLRLRRLRPTLALLE